MQQFFQIHIKLACSFALLLSILLMQLPEQQTHYSRHTLDKWVKQHLELEADVAPAGDETPQAEGAAPLPAAAKDGIVSYLYIAWTQHQGASGMAGVFVQDRVLTHIIQKHGNGLNWGGNATLTPGHSAASFVYNGIYDYWPKAVQLFQMPGLSGTFINAP